MARPISTKAKIANDVRICIHNRPNLGSASFKYVHREKLLACEPRNVSRLLAFVRNENLPNAFLTSNSSVDPPSIVLAVADVALPPNI